MSDDMLSRAEVESLLHAGERDLLPLSATTPQRQSARTSSVRSRERTVPPGGAFAERINAEQMRALQLLHEEVGRSFGDAVSVLLRNACDVRLTSVEQLTYSEFVFSLENPTCFNLLRARPLDGSLILDLNLAILYPMIDRLLGGGHDADLPARRPLTEIELLLASQITTIFNRELQQAWANILDVEFTVDRVECNPQRVQVMPPTDAVVVIRFEVALGASHGVLKLCIPLASLEPIRGKLTTNHWDENSRHLALPDALSETPMPTNGSRVRVVVTLAESTVTTADLIGLRVGDVITTEQDVEAPLRVDIEGVEPLRASPGALQGNKAIQLLDPLVTRHD